jgi:hypothetical protein
VVSFWSAVVRGGAAGAAGTTALNAVTYLDMALRGRPSSSTPEDTVEKLAHSAHLEVPGDDETRSNRLAGLGPLTGIATGVAVGALTGLIVRSSRLATPVLGGVVAGVAMVGSNGPMTLLGITDPRTWSASSWISDIVPHLAYGVVTAAVARSLVRPLEG